MNSRWFIVQCPKCKNTFVTEVRKGLPKGKNRTCYYCNHYFCIHTNVNNTNIVRRAKQGYYRKPIPKDSALSFKAKIETEVLRC